MEEEGYSREWLELLAQRHGFRLSGADIFDGPSGHLVCRVTDPAQTIGILSVAGDLSVAEERTRVMSELRAVNRK